jgi:hypothetical protein
MQSGQSRSSQIDLPDTQARIGETLQRHANAPLKPSKPQTPCDSGLFGDAHKQGEMF